jgi:heme-degrading monooxygenase HmoA
MAPGGRGNPSARQLGTTSSYRRFMLVASRESQMHARNLTFHLKAKTADEFTRTVEKDVLPVMRKQNGFKDVITFVAAGRNEAVSISLWDKKESAEAYNRNTYPQVLKSLDKVVEGTPKLDAFEVSNSTFHNIAAARN